MQVILDNLMAVVISSVLVFIFALLQLRGMSNTSETSLNYMVRTETLSIARMLEQDIENMRTEDQTNEAIANGDFTGGGVFSCVAVDGGTDDLTLEFTFPTLLDHQGTTSLSDPTTADVQLISYVLVDTGTLLPLKSGGTTTNLPLYRLERRVNGVSGGGSRGYVIDFKVEFLQGGTGTPLLAHGRSTPSNVSCPSDMKKVRFQIKMATDAITNVTHDQESTSQLNFSRYGNTIDLINWQ